MSYYEDDSADIAELRAQDAHDRRYRSKLYAAPDCRDPDHPGCTHCEDEDEMKTYIIRTTYVLETRVEALDEKTALEISQEVGLRPDYGSSGTRKIKGLLNVDVEYTEIETIEEEI